MSTVIKGMWWGVGIMAVVSILGSLLGPSPLNIIFAPILSITSIPLAGYLTSVGGVYGEGLNLVVVAVFVGWNIIVGGVIGAIVGRLVRR